MNPKRLWTTVATVLALSASGPHSSGVRAQFEMAVCRPGWNWNKNSLGQDACAIASALDAACRGLATYTIPPINGTQNYVPPDSSRPEDLDCQCDTVVYSLYMECTMCQGGIYFSWLQWINECVTVRVADYSHDVPQGTAIPRWAFFNVTSLPNKTFNETMAIAIGRDPEASPRPLSTVGRSSSSSTSPLPTTKTRTLPGSVPSPTNTSDDDNSGGGTNVGAIVGGVVGSVVPLTIFAVLVFLYMRRRQQNGGDQPPVRPLSQVSEFYKGNPTSPTLGPTGAPLQYNTYRPGDYATYPAPLSDGQSSLTNVNPISPLSPNGRGQYRGAAEI